jgi:peptide/nickel transport system permease protein
MSRTRLFFRRWQNWIGLILVLAFIFVAVAAPYLSPNDPKNPGPFMRVGRAFESRPLPPDENAILGLLPRGIDVYHALVWGARDALRFGLIVTVSTALFGIFYGSVSGFAGGRVGSFLLSVADSFLAFPPIAGVVFLQQLFVTTITSLGGFYTEGEIFSFTNTPIAMTLIQTLLEQVNPLMLSLILFSWMPYARLVHAIVITLKQTDFIQAARALGGSPFWIIRKHLLRNSTGPAMVLAARDVGGIVLLQATLTFINIGGDSVWGIMLAQGRNWILGPGGSLFTYWWVFLPPTLAVILFGIAWNVFGDSLNDLLMPTSSVSTHGQKLWNRKRRKEEPQTPPEEAVSVSAAAVLPENTPVQVDKSPSELPQKKPSVNGANPVLHTARDELSRGDLPRALHAYRHLIQHGRLIDELLPDLAQLVKKYPRDPQVWQTLGDALTQAGDSAHATQSYDRAQKLRQYGNPLDD